MAGSAYEYEPWRYSDYAESLPKYDAEPTLFTEVGAEFADAALARLLEAYERAVISGRLLSGDAVTSRFHRLPPLPAIGLNGKLHASKSASYETDAAEVLVVEYELGSRWREGGALYPYPVSARVSINIGNKNAACKELFIAEWLNRQKPALLVNNALSQNWSLTDRLLCLYDGLKAAGF